MHLYKTGTCGLVGRARQPSSGVTWVRSLPAAPSRCGSGTSGPEPSGWLINQLVNPSLLRVLQICNYIDIEIDFVFPVR